MRRKQSDEDPLSLRSPESNTQSSSKGTLFKHSPYSRKGFCNHSQGRNMPIILNVFSLCDESDSKSKEMRRNNNQENDLSVTTPPCSPPLPPNDLGTTSIISENDSSCYESRTCSPYDLTNSSATVNSTIPSNLLVNSYCAQSIRMKYTNQPPTLQNHKKYTLEYLPDKNEYSTNVRNGHFTTNNEASFHNGQSHFVHSNECFSRKTRLMYHDSNGFAPKRTHCDSKGEISAKRQYVITKLVQHIERNKYSK